MFAKSHSFKFETKCISVDYSKFNKVFLIAYGNTINIFKKDNLVLNNNILNNNNKNNNTSLDSIYTFLCTNDIILSRFNHDGDKLCVTDLDQNIIVYQFKSNNEEVNEIYKSEVSLFKSWKFAFCPKSNSIAYGCYNLNVYNPNNKKTISSNTIPGNYYYCLTYTNDNKIAVGNITGSISIYNGNNLKKEDKIDVHCKPIRSLIYLNEKNQLISASDDLHINVTNIHNKNKLEYSLVGHKDIITCMNSYKIMYNNKEYYLLVTGSLDGNIKFWDIEKNYLEVQNIKFKSEILDMCITEDGEYIVIGTNEGCEVIKKNNNCNIN